jgi:hypothetical protein
MDEIGRYRGVIRVSLVAGGLMSALATGALAVGLATGLVPASLFGARELIAVAIRGFGAGAVAGGLFAWFVARHERGQTLSTLSARRVALWGGLATASVPLLSALGLLATTGRVLPIGILAASSMLAGLGGSAVSAGMLRVARRAPAAHRA